MAYFHRSTSALVFICLGLSLSHSSAKAQAKTQAKAQIIETEDKEKAQDNYIEVMQIIGDQAGLRTQAGSATFIDQSQLEDFKFNDINQVLAQVPGVNLRQEDGFGLRPNIGFRGATPERSKKINIMEDGVLIGPAPYSAPSAYYFPMLNKITAIEVFKGPAAIQYGPNTVAGALNLVTRPVPDAQFGLLDLAYGNTQFNKQHGVYGNRIAKLLNDEDSLGFLMEGVRLASDGFKDLANGQNTGFDKYDLMGKLQYQFDSEHFSQLLEFKYDYAKEQSNETYLGLTEADVEQAPNQRYAASTLDQMDWQHQQWQLTHFLAAADYQLTTRAYRHNFDRAWNKLNGFRGGFGVDRSLQQVLSDPDFDELNQTLYQILTGRAESVTESQMLILGNNDRSYYAQGIQVDFDFDFELFEYDNNLELGLRWHQDQIERNHTIAQYAMSQGALINDGEGASPATTDREQTKAWSLYVEHRLQLAKWTLNTGVRGEWIDAHYQNRAPDEADNYLNKDTRIWLPSFSAFYQYNAQFGLLFGVHQGFLPTSPKQAPDIAPEKSINYELGGRFANQTFSFDLIGFFHDIENLKEGCQFSSCGSDNDLEFNGGEVDVWGAELTLNYQHHWTQTLHSPITLAYTYSDSKFLTSFDSEFDMWGQISQGDRLPYLPKNQLTLGVGLASAQWQLNLLGRYIGEMLEASGTGVELTGKRTQALTVIDLAANYELGRLGSVYAKVDNVFDQQKIASRRPYGARPNAPRLWQLGYQYRF